MKKTKIITASIILAICIISIISTANALIITSFNTNPSEMQPGKTATIDLVLKNNEEDDIEDVSVSLDFTNIPLAPYSSGSDYSFDEIESDKTKRVQFQVIALSDAKAGIYKIPVKISYNDGNGTKVITSLISIKISSLPIIDASVEDGLLLKGQQNTVSIKVINKGLADARFLEINLASDSGYTLTSQPNVYIGDVDSNDFQTAEYKIFFKETSSNSISIPLTITYKDFSDKEYTKNIEVDAKVYSQEQAKNLGLVKKSNVIYYVLIVLAIILVFVLYRVIRNRRRKAEDF